MNITTSSYGDTGSTSVQSSQDTHGMVRARTVEIALIAGRSSIEIRQRDYEQAKRELTGESDFERQLAVLYPESFS